MQTVRGRHIPNFGLQMLRVPMIVRQEATQLTFLDKGPGVTDDRSSKH